MNVKATISVVMANKKRGKKLLLQVVLFLVVVTTHDSLILKTNKPTKGSWMKEDCSNKTKKYFFWGNGLGFTLNKT
jgi:hypothetical protein